MVTDVIVIAVMMIEVATAIPAAGLARQNLKAPLKVGLFYGNKTFAERLFNAHLDIIKSSGFEYMEVPTMKTLLFSFILFSFHLAFASTFSIGSWNLHGGSKIEDTEKEFQQSNIGQSSIMLFQESGESSSVDYADIFAQKYGYEIHRVGSNAILSKFPLSGQGGILVYAKENRIIPFTDLTFSNGTVMRVYCLHLTYKDGWNPFVSDLRGEEMKLILNHAKGFSGPIIIAGDFNTVGKFTSGHENEAAIKLIKEAGFKDALEAIGGSTNLLVGRIDWIFSRGLELIDSMRGDFGGSDHRWIQASFSVPQK
jgi:endonuclease/exonuclease/phosphatase family metal-dependent hydrolase